VRDREKKVEIERDIYKLIKGIAGLQSNLVDWIVIYNPKSKSDFGFGLSIQYCHFNPNPKYQNYFIKKLNFIVHHAPTMKPSYILAKFSNN